MSNSWYKDWFNTKYYHILYKNRDFKEAEDFIKNLSNHLKIAKNAKILDLACGKGRHSIFLNKLGYDVTGIDLSAESIEEARKMRSKNLQFIEGDMRVAYKENYFDYIFNLFTSFGYFNDIEDNHAVVLAIAKGLKHRGVGVIDFFNAHLVRKSLPEQKQVLIDDIVFQTNKFEADEMVHKEIVFEEGNEKYTFKESVKLFGLEDFQLFLSKAGLKLVDVFGSYGLDSFDVEKSKRMILLFKKD